MTAPGVASGDFGPSRRGVDFADGVIWSRDEPDRRRDASVVAEAVANALFWDLALPRHRIVADCDGDWVTLRGEVERAYQRSSAEADVLRVQGVRGVTNAITVGEAALESGQEAASVKRPNG